MSCTEIETVEHIKPQCLNVASLAVQCACRRSDGTIATKGASIANGKPFVKWVGGKGQLLDTLQKLLPKDFATQSGATYIEPFVGGGAMLFYMLQHYPNIEHAVINDVNPDLTTCYRVVRDCPHQLIAMLQDIQKRYYACNTEEERKRFYLATRQRYNQKTVSEIENTTLFLFLNRTCFNGLYRVNLSGQYNVPFGRYESPIICHEDLILADSELLQRVEILTGDFEQTLVHAAPKSLFYFDPPYRPLSTTSSFNTYAKEPFNDDAQIRLKQFCDKVAQAGHAFMLSNSDGQAKNSNDTFFDDLYADYNIARVWASRSVNANGAKRGKLTEILVRNYQ